MFNMGIRLAIFLAGICIVGCQNIRENGFVTHYLDIPIDHYSFRSNATFKLRLLINDTFYTNNGPIFLYTGNEGDIETFAENTGFMYDIAPEFDALLVFAEHRYYGESLPFGNLSYSSPEHLGYLSTPQALSDFVFVIEYLQATYLKDKEILDRLPVIAFGGSYGGMLSAYLRMKFPNSVAGAIASSAPIWAFKGLMPCGNFYRIVSDVYKYKGSKNCRNTIAKSWKYLRNLAETDDGKKWITQTFNLCNNITKSDIDTMVDWLANIYTNIAMVNYPYPTSFLKPLPANPVYEFCLNVDHSGSDNDAKTVLTSIADALLIYTNYTGQIKCNSINETSDSMGETGWDFQACTEMIMPMCSTSDDMFETSPWDWAKYADDCFNKFGVRPVREDLPVLEFGGRNLADASNIVFSNGLLDPWSSGGVLNNISSKVSAIVIPEAAHHLDLRAANPADPQSVIKARTFHATMIKRWLDKYIKDHTNPKVMLA